MVISVPHKVACNGVIYQSVKCIPNARKWSAEGPIFCLWNPHTNLNRRKWTKFDGPVANTDVRSDWSTELCLETQCLYLCASGIVTHGNTQTWVNNEHVWTYLLPKQSDHGSLTESRIMLPAAPLARLSHLPGLAPSAEILPLAMPQILTPVGVGR